MGCCCCCVSDRKAGRGDVPLSNRQDPESQDSTQPRNSTAGPPPPYDEKDNGIPDVVSFPKELLQEPPPSFSIDTSHEHDGKAVRVGVRSHDQRLYCAAAGGHLDEVKRLLESGFNPSDRTICDWCPLHWAANNDIEHGHSIVKLLVEYGADINQLSDTGKTPLDMARSAKRADNVAFLESVGAKTGVEVRRERMESLVIERA